jgi:hypothetical protein
MKERGIFGRKYPLIWLIALTLGLSWALLPKPGLAFIFAEEVWYNRYSANAGYPWPVALEQASRDVYVTGISQVNHGEINHDYVTVRYSSGQEAWARFYNGTGNEDDVAVDLALSSLGNPHSKAFNKRSIQSRFHGPIGGPLYVTGTSKGVSGTGSDFLTVKYSPSGQKVWERRYNSPDGNDEIAAALVVDRHKNVYVTGFSGTFDLGEGGCDYLTIKYTPSGTKVWEAFYHGNEEPYNIALAMAVDEEGNVYLSGYSGDLTSLDILTIKLDADGNFLWESRYPGPDPWAIVMDLMNNFMIKKVMLALDAEGNVLVIGPSLGAVYQHDYATIKYRAADGYQMWHARYDNLPLGGDDIPTAIALDDQGNVYVTGYCANDSFGYDMVTVKYGGIYGYQQDSARYSDASGANYATALSLDAVGNVYITGESNGDFLTIRYKASTLEEEWTIRKACPAGDSRATDIAVIPGTADLYVTGYSKAPEGDGYDFLTVQYHQVNWDIVIR